jgi:hypothetical protein
MGHEPTISPSTLLVQGEKVPFKLELVGHKFVCLEVLLFYPSILIVLPKSNSHLIRVANSPFMYYNYEYLHKVDFSWAWFQQ